MKRLFISSFFMMNFLLVNGQINGLVVNSSNHPLNDVEIYFADRDIIQYTNNNGEFYSQKDLPNKSYIYFTKHGYTTKSVLYQNNMPLKIILEPLHVTLDEVGVTESFNVLGNGKLTNIESKSLDFSTYNSVLESVTQLSGIDMISSGLGIQKVVVRGLSGMRVVTYLNGMQINNQQWANDHGIGFTDLGLQEVELIKGASALKYGSEAIGGLLYFKDYPFVSSDRLNGFFASKFNNSSYLSSNQFGLKWNKKNLYFNLYGQYSLSADYRFPNNRYFFNSRFEQKAVKFSIGYNKNKWQNIFRYQLHTEIPGIPGHIHGDPDNADIMDITSYELDLSNSFTTTRPNQIVENQLFIYETNYFINDFKLSLFSGYFINNLQEWEKWTRPAFDIDLSNTQISPSIRYTSRNLTFNLGTQFNMLENKNNIYDRLVPDASSFNIGSYILVDYEENNFGINTGLRYDYKRLEVTDQTSQFNLDYDNTFSSTSFSTGFYYQLAEKIFRFTYSGAYRAPHFSELFSEGVHHGTNRYEVGSNELAIEYANQFDFKYQWSNNHLGIVLNPFIQYISDFISINPTDSTVGSYKVYNYVQYDRVEITGVEINLHYHPHQLHNLHLEQSYSFLHTKNKDDQYGLALVPANSVKNKILYDLKQHHKLRRYRLDYISFFHTYKFKQESFAEFEELTDAYNVVSFQLGFKLNKNFHCNIGIDNLLNKKYTPHISRVRGVAGGVPNPGRAFNINLKYEF